MHSTQDGLPATRAAGPSETEGHVSRPVSPGSGRRPARPSAGGMASANGRRPDRPQLEPFRIEEHPDRQSIRVAPVGELDVATVPQVDERLRELCHAGFDHLILDLRGLTFVDSSGLRLVLQWDARARQDGFGFALIEGSPTIQSMFAVCGVLDRLPFRAR